MRSTEVMALRVAGDFGAKWKAHDEALRCLALLTSREQEGCPPHGRRRMWHGRRRFAGHMSVREAWPLQQWLLRRLQCQWRFCLLPADGSSTSGVLNEELHAVAFGKESASPALDRIRVIMPLPTAMGVRDVLRAREIHACLDSRGPPDGVVREGALLGASASDVVLGRSHGAIAQGDVWQPWDHLPVCKCCAHLVASDLPAATAAVAVRHQPLPRVSIRVGASSAEVSPRASGGLTESRIAGAPARVVIRDLLEASAHRSAHWALTWVRGAAS